MFIRIKNFTARWGLVQRFTLASFIIMLLGMFGIGRWVGEQIKQGVVEETAATTALYMDSFIAPNLQELSQPKPISQEHVAVLSNLLLKTNLGRQMVSFKVWDREGRIIYSTIPALIGQTFPDDLDQAPAWQGEVVAEISDLQTPENVEERRLYERLLQIYSPVRLSGTDQVIAVAEFYQKVDKLETKIAAAQRWSWFVVGTTMTIIYLLLVGFVRWAANTIGRQESTLQKQVTQLTDLLARNDELNGRVRRAAANTVALNENFLRRTSAELHDGPVQEVSLALLRLDRAMEQLETCRLSDPKNKCDENLPIVQTALQTALQEMRAIAAGLGLPQLENLPLPEIFTRVVRSHEKRTSTRVELRLSGLPEQASLPVKVTVYRLVQEALNNASNHAGGAGQQVRAGYEKELLEIEISDQGPGFDLTQPVEWGGREHLGLVGMRERVESLGGTFRIESRLNEGTKVLARLSPQNTGENANG